MTTKKSSRRNINKNMRPLATKRSATKTEVSRLCKKCGGLKPDTTERVGLGSLNI